jgi:plasmid stability protein
MVDILVRNVSPELHRELKIEAVRQGVTLSEAARRRMNSAEPLPKPRAFTKADWLALRLPNDGLPSKSPEEWADEIREMRAERDAQIETAIYGKPLPHTYGDK